MKLKDKIAEMKKEAMLVIEKADPLKEEVFATTRHGVARETRLVENAEGYMEYCYVTEDGRVIPLEDF